MNKNKRLLAMVLVAEASLALMGKPASADLDCSTGSCIESVATSITVTDTFLPVSPIYSPYFVGGAGAPMTPYAGSGGLNMSGGNDTDSRECLPNWTWNEQHKQCEMNSGTDNTVLGAASFLVPGATKVGQLAEGRPILNFGLNTLEAAAQAALEAAKVRANNGLTVTKDFVVQCIEGNGCLRGIWNHAAYDAWDQTISNILNRVSSIPVIVDPCAINPNFSWCGQSGTDNGWH